MIIERGITIYKSKWKTWYQTLSVECPHCSCSIVVEDYKIDKKGNVSPILWCSRCTFAEYVKLEDFSA